MMARHDILIDMAMDGHPPRAIAAETGLKTATVKAYLYRARRDGVPVPRFTAARIDGATCLTLPDAIAARLREQAPALTMGASYCVFDVNIHEIGAAALRAKEAGLNYLEVRPVFPTEWRGGGFGNPLTEAHTERARDALAQAKAAYDGDGFRVIGMIHRFEQVGAHVKPYGRCHIGPITTVINADGYIYHCCQQRGMANFRAGSVLHRPFAEVWWNAQHQQMVEGIDVTKCPPCRYDGYNQIVEQAFQKDAMHANFL